MVSVSLLEQSPVWAALIGVLEGDVRSGRGGQVPLEPPDGVRADAVAQAAREVNEMSPVELLARAVLAGSHVVGPWNPDAPAGVARAIRDARLRRPITQVALARLGDRLHAALDPDAQLWWTTQRHAADDPRAWNQPLGEQPRRSCPAWLTATWDGLWTCTHAQEHDTPVPDDGTRSMIGDALIAAWEHAPGPSTRWHLQVDPGARIYEIDSPADWERLVRLAPLARQQRYVSWEFPGMDVNEYDISDLDRLAGQRAARHRDAFRYFVEPDWDRVADRFDAVHLTWAGLLTTEGVVIDLDNQDVTMLRGWYSERTLWLNPVLSAPRPAPGPRLTRAYCGVVGLDVEHEPERRVQDLALLESRLGPRGSTPHPGVAGDT